MMVMGLAEDGGDGEMVKGLMMAEGRRIKEERYCSDTILKRIEKIRSDICNAIYDGCCNCKVN